MARLPQPGGDIGAWAELLNQYLLITHDDDGTQRTGSISSGALQRGSVGVEHLRASGAPATLRSTVSGAPDGDLVLVQEGDALVWKSTLALAAPVRQTTINVADYGAIGDGKTDDTAAVQRAIDAAPQGGSVVFPFGIYMVTGLKISNKGTALVGAARWGTRLVRLRGNKPLLDISGTGTGIGHLRYVSLNNIMLQGNDMPGVLLRSYYADNCMYREVNFIHCKGVATDFVEVWDTHFEDCTWEDCGSVDNPAMLMRNSTARGAFGFSNDNTNQIHFVGCRWEGFRNGAVRLDGQAGGSTELLNGIFFVACKMETALAAGAVLQLMKGATVIFVTQLYIAVTGADIHYHQPIDAIIDSATHTLMSNVYVQWGKQAGLAGSSVHVMRSGPHMYQEFAAFYPVDDPRLGTIVAEAGTDVLVGTLWSNRGYLTMGDIRTMMVTNPTLGVAIPLNHTGAFRITSDLNGNDLLKLDYNPTRPALHLLSGVDAVGFAHQYVDETWRIVGSTGAARFANNKFQIAAAHGYTGINTAPLAEAALLINVADEGDRGIVVVRPSGTATNRLMEFQDEDHNLQGQAIDSHGRPLAVGTPPVVTPGAQATYATPRDGVQDIAGGITAAVKPSPTAPGTIAKVVFSRAYAAVPKAIAIHDHSVVAADLYISSRSVKGFVVSTRQALRGGSILSFDYTVVA